MLQTSDSGHVEVRMSQDTNLAGSGYLEVIGRVSADGEHLTEFTCIDLGNNLGRSIRNFHLPSSILTLISLFDPVDLDIVQKLVEIQQKVPEVFG